MGFDTLCNYFRYNHIGFTDECPYDFYIFQLTVYFYVQVIYVGHNDDNTELIYNLLRERYNEYSSTDWIMQTDDETEDQFDENDWTQYIQYERMHYFII